MNVREDKAKAVDREWRTPEDSLKRDAWLGGIGGLVALYICKHKTATKKLDFMQSYKRNTCIGLVVQAICIIVLLIVLL